LESLLQPFLQQLSYDKDAQNVFQNPKLLADAAYEGLIGGILGMFGSGTNTAVDLVANMIYDGTMPGEKLMETAGVSESEVIGAIVLNDMVTMDEAAGNEYADSEALEFFSVGSRDKLTSIVKRSTIKTQSGFSCFPDGDPLNANIQNVAPMEGYFDAAMHGTPTMVGFGTSEMNMSPRLLASVIRHSEGYRGQNVRLLSCSTGKIIDGEYCFAEELANALGVEVSAPNDTLFIFKSGEFRIGKRGDGAFVSFQPNQRRRFR